MQRQSHGPVHPADIHHPAHPANRAAQAQRPPTPHTPVQDPRAIPHPYDHVSPVPHPHVVHGTPIQHGAHPMQGGHPMQHPGQSPHPMHHPGQSPHPIDHSQLMARHPVVAHGGHVPRHATKKHRKNRPQQDVVPSPMAGPQTHLGFEQDLPPIQAPVPADHRHELIPAHVHDHAFGPGQQWHGESQVAGGYMTHTMPKPRFPNVHGFVPRQRDHNGWGGQGANGHQRGVIQGYANWNAHYH